MSDPSGPLQTALIAFLKADAGVQAAMTQPVPKVYDVPPSNAAKPYLTIGDHDLLPDTAEGLEATETDANIHVWSLTTPPGQAEAKAVAAAVQAALCPGDGGADPPAMAVEGFRLTDAILVRARHMLDPADGKTAHSIVTIRFLLEPA